MPALHALWRWPGEERRHAAGAFAAVFVAGMALVFWPMHAARPRVPHSGFAVLALAGNLGRLGTTLIETAARNLMAFSFFGPQSWQRVHTLQAMTVLVAAVAGLRLGGARRQLAAVAAWSYLARDLRGDVVFVSPE